MANTARRQVSTESRVSKFVETVRRAFVEFLRVPLLIIAGFLLLAALTWELDHAKVGWLRPIHLAIRMALFRDAQATGDLLATIAGSIITVTSITFSLLLLAVQQAAGALTPVVYDQFLRRRINQGYFGFCVGLALYALVILATVNRPYNPVFGAAVALLLTIVALMMMVLLLYTTINQMRPVVVIEAIHDHVLRARERQLVMLSRTRRVARHDGAMTTPVRARAHGYVGRLNLDRLSAAVGKAHAEVEIVVQVPIGHYVACRDTLATVWTAAPEDVAAIAEAVLASIELEQQRDLDSDPAYGIDQLAIIGWTSISTAKSNPGPGALVLHGLRDVLARWSEDMPEERAVDQPVARANAPVGASADANEVAPLPVVYVDDVFPRLMDAFETLAVVASESMQPQTMSEFVRAFALMFPRLPVEQKGRAEDVIRRSLSGLGEHVLTGPLSEALTDLARVLGAAGRSATAAEVRLAHATLEASIGKLGSRATRAGGVP